MKHWTECATDQGSMATRILLVEPAQSDSNAKFLLQSLGYKVTRVTNTEAALEAVIHQHIGLVIASIHLQEKADLLVKQLKAANEVPVLILSPFSETFEFSIARCISAGADDVMSEELMETLISSQIQSVLEKEALRRQQAEYLSEIKNQKELLEERNYELQATNELKNKFIGMAAHDLRNPLASIRGFSEILLEGELNEEQRDFLTIINTNSSHMLNLVHDLLDVAVIESRKLELDLQPVSLGTLVRERISVFKGLAQHKGSRMVVTTDNDEADVCQLDIGRSIQVIDNLLSNAIKFSPPGSTISVTEQIDNQHVSISVKDEGPGLTEEDQKYMFQDFGKLSAKPTGDESSTGLGLAIVKRIVEAHKGEIRVESELGKGANFIFRLPKSH